MNKQVSSKEVAVGSTQMSFGFGQTPFEKLQSSNGVSRGQIEFIQMLEHLKRVCSSRKKSR